MDGPTATKQSRRVVVFSVLISSHDNISNHGGLFCGLPNRAQCLLCGYNIDDTLQSTIYPRAWRE